MDNKTPYHYTECGLDNVLLYGIESCIDDEGDLVTTIININGLHKAIAHAIVSHDSLMNGKELRFLRTAMDMTQAELASKLNRDQISVGRWERSEFPIDPNAELITRLLAKEKLELSVNISVSELTSNVRVSTNRPISIDGRDPSNYCTPTAA